MLDELERNLRATLHEHGEAAPEAPSVEVLTAAARRNARVRRRARGLVVLALAGVVAATVASPVLRSERRPSAATSTVPSRGGARPVDARQFLLAVAARAERQPAHGGAYRYEEERSSTVSTFGTGGKMGRGPAYTVELSQTTRSWVGASRWRSVTTFEEPRFLTERDRANWRKAGAPALRFGTAPGVKKEMPSNPSVEEDTVVAVRFVVGYQELTLAQVRRLPADTARLTAWLRAAIQPALDKRPPAGAKPEPGFQPLSVEELLFAAAADVLGLPVDPAVRAAAFRVMAGVHGAKLMGAVTDPMGRTGTGVAFRESPDADRVYIVDEATADLLAQQYVPSNPARSGVRVPPGTPILSITLVESGWVDRLGQQP